MPGKQTIFNCRYTFDTFNINFKNNKAFEACSSIASNTWSGSNVLFIYGNTGTGKTHLLISLFKQFLKMQPRRNIRYIESYRFIHDFIESIKNKDQNSFQKHFDELDLLLFDDFDEIKGKEQTQVEICHIISELQNKGKMIVIAGIYHPKKHKNCYRKLFSRINRGRIIKIQ